MTPLVNYTFSCPYCGELLTFVLETIHGDSSYIEDCEVCCQPIQIQYAIAATGEVVNFHATQA